MRKGTFLSGFAILGLVSPCALVAAAEPSIFVIAVPGTSDHRLTRDTVARLFLRKQVVWQDGVRVQPVNLPVGNAVRQAFSQDVLGHPPEAFEDYWRDMYFHGSLPPHVLDSENAVARFVSSTPGAIGYVGSCAAAQKFEILLVVGPSQDCQK